MPRSLAWIAPYQGPRYRACRDHPFPGVGRMRAPETRDVIRVQARDHGYPNALFESCRHGPPPIGCRRSCTRAGLRSLNEMRWQAFSFSFNFFLLLPTGLLGTVSIGTGCTDVCFMTWPQISEQSGRRKVRSGRCAYVRQPRTTGFLEGNHKSKKGKIPQHWAGLWDDMWMPKRDLQWCPVDALLSQRE